jgi:multisubunit Na+/H+ antiporter MnhE subunit
MFQHPSVWLTSWLILSLLWLLFVGKFTWHELLVGIGAAALSTFVLWLVTIRSAVKFAPTLPWIRQIWRVPWLMGRDCWLLVRHLLAQLCLGKEHGGTFRVLRFPGGADDAPSTARRVLAVTYSTLPPNAIVIDIDREANYMLLHQLEKDAPSDLLKRLRVP